MCLKINQPNWFFPKLFYGEESLIEAYKELIYRIVRYLNMRSSDSEIKMQVNEMIAIEKSFGLVCNLNINIIQPFKFRIF